MAKTQKPADIDGYISVFPADVQGVLEQVRATIRRAAPDAKEVISYQMPAFKQYGMLVYFAAWKEHIGLYPLQSPQSRHTCWLGLGSRRRRAPRSSSSRLHISRFRSYRRSQPKKDADHPRLAGRRFEGALFHTNAFSASWSRTPSPEFGLLGHFLSSPDV